MDAGDKVSRREWFRLRTRPANTGDTVNRANHSMGTVSNGLQPISHPVNHDGMDLSELPPMREAVLSFEQLGQLFSDIKSLASDVLLMQRSARS